MNPLFPLVPKSLANCSKPPALLRIFYSLSQYDNTVKLIAKRPEIVKIMILCIATQNVELAVVKLVIEILNSLMDFDFGNCLLPHSEVIQKLYKILIIIPF